MAALGKGRGGSGKAKAKAAKKPSAKAKEASAEVIEAIGTRGSGMGRFSLPKRRIRTGGYQPDSEFHRMEAAANAADVRTDLGAPIDLRVPVGYWSQVRLALEWFDSDPLFRMLIGRFWEFGNNRADWVVAPQDTKAEKEAERTQRFLNYWSSIINLNIEHVLPGLDSVNVATFKSLLLAGMAPMHWSWGWIEFEDQQYWVPVSMRVENPLSVVIAPQTTYAHYAAFLKVQNQNEQSVGANAAGGAQELRKNKDYREMRPSNAFILRFEHCQLDARVNRTSGGRWGAANVMGTDDQNAGYPAVPYIQLREAMQQRRGLAASDIRIIDGIINYILLWKVGTGDVGKDGRPLYPIRPTTKNPDGSEKNKGTIDLAKEYLENAEYMDILELVLPYWISLETITPDTSSLLSSSKYWHPTSDILHRFGLFLGEDASNPEISKMSTVVFEAQVDNLRETHVGRLWEAIASKIMLHPKNGGRFGASIVSYVWRPLLTRVAETRKELIEAFKLGRISHETLMRAFGRSPSAERARIAQEIKDGLPATMNQNTPTQFVQRTVDNDGKAASISDGGTARGRPRTKDAKTSTEDS